MSKKILVILRDKPYLCSTAEDSRTCNTYLIFQHWTYRKIIFNSKYFMSVCFCAHFAVKCIFFFKKRLYRRKQVAGWGQQYGPHWPLKRREEDVKRYNKVITDFSASPHVPRIEAMLPRNPLFYSVVSRVSILPRRLRRRWFWLFQILNYTLRLPLVLQSRVPLLHTPLHLLVFVSPFYSVYPLIFLRMELNQL